jgi:hypothetical protein
VSTPIQVGEWVDPIEEGPYGGEVIGEIILQGVRHLMIDADDNRRYVVPETIVRRRE